MHILHFRCNVWQIHKVTWRIHVHVTMTAPWIHTYVNHKVRGITMWVNLPPYMHSNFMWVLLSPHTHSDICPHMSLYKSYYNYHLCMHAKPPFSCVSYLGLCQFSTSMCHSESHFCVTIISLEGVVQYEDLGLWSYKFICVFTCAIFTAWA